MDNISLLKYLLILLTAPFWFPFAKALWDEFNDALRVDGGLFGDTPSRTERERIEREIAQEPPKLVSETLAHARIRKQRRAAGLSEEIPGENSAIDPRRGKGR